MYGSWDMVDNGQMEWQKMWHLEVHAPPTNAVIRKHYGPASSHTQFIWKEDLNLDGLKNRQETINTISKGMPEFFSRAYKLKCKSLASILMHN